MKRLLSVPLRVLLPVLLLSCAAIAGLISWKLNTGLLAGEIESQFLDEARLRITALQATMEYHARKGDANGVNLAVSGAATRNDVIAAYVLDRQDRILAATRNATIGNAAEAIAIDLPADLKGRHAMNIAQVRASTNGSMVLSQDRRVAVAYYPLLVDVDEHALRSVRNGLVVLVLDMQMAKARAFRAAGRQALDNALVFGGLAACAWIFVHFSLTRRVARLVATTRKLASGDLTARTGIEGSDELALVAEAFDLMAGRIAEDIRCGKQVEGELRESKHFAESIADNSTSIIYLFELGTGRSIYANRNVAEFLGYSQAQIVELGGNILPRIMHPEDLPRIAQQHADYATAADGRVFELEFRLKHATGEWRWISARETVFKRRPDGVPWQILGSAHDVTERKQAEAALAKAHRELVDASWQAGMAEVATGVLHNVGNVLNSVNTSISVATDKIRGLKLATFHRLAELLRGQQDLAAFFTSDPRGTGLPAFLQSVTGQIESDRAAALAELDALHRHIEHINEIVAMQQTHATVCGATEALPLADLIEDALRLNAGSIERHSLQIVREYAGLPPVPVNRHKVLQILVNLIHNAKHALEDGAPADKRITLRLTMDGQDCAQIAVNDNGVGIPEENLTRIFEHGFTTRKDGHGFGLHSSANSAREMGGSLTAQSAGPGRGATFTLDLPLHSEKS